MGTSTNAQADATVLVEGVEDVSLATGHYLEKRRCVPLQRYGANDLPY